MIEEEKKKKKRKCAKTMNEEVFKVCAHIYSLCSCHSCIKQLKASVFSLQSSYKTSMLGE